MKNNYELRMTGVDRDIVLNKSTEIIHSLTGNNDELIIYMQPDSLDRTIRINVHLRIYVSYFIFDNYQDDQAVIPLKTDHTMVCLESSPLKALILHLLELKDKITPELQRHYVDIIFHYIESEVGFDQPFSESGNSKQVLMERLRAHIDRNVKSNLSVKSLTDVCHMSERSLYYLFRESEATTPLSYIQQRKIAHVHSEICDRKSRRSITQIAMDYGFSNLGRFSQLYREQVGELPSVTRSRATDQVLRA